MATYGKIKVSLRNFDTKKLRRLFHKMDFSYQIYSMTDFNEILMQGKNYEEIIGTLYSRYHWDRKDIEHAYYSSYHVVEDGYDIMASGESFSFVEFCNSAGIEESDVIDNILDDFEMYKEFFEDILPAEDREIVISKLKTLTTFGWYKVLNLVYDEGLIKDRLFLNSRELRDHTIKTYSPKFIYDTFTMNKDIGNWKYALIDLEDHSFCNSDTFEYVSFEALYDATTIVDFIAEYYHSETPIFNKSFKDIIESNQQEKV